MQNGIPVHFFIILFAANLSDEGKHIELFSRFFDFRNKNSF